MPSLQSSQRNAAGSTRNSLLAVRFLPVGGIPFLGGAGIALLIVWMRIVLGRASADVVPWRLGPNEYVHLDFHARVTFNATKRDPMYSSVVSSAKSRTTNAAKLKPPARGRLERHESILARRPRKVIRFHFSVR